MKNLDLPLKAKLTKEGKVVIEIGIDTLAWVAENMEYNNPYREEVNAWTPQIEILDAKEFAQDVVNAMNDEAEDGSSKLTEFVDQVCIAAIEAGSLGVEECEE